MLDDPWHRVEGVLRTNSDGQNEESDTQRTLTVFNKLPLELRLKTWELVMDEVVLVSSSYDGKMKRRTFTPALCLPCFKLAVSLARLPRSTTTNSTFVMRLDPVQAFYCVPTHGTIFLETSFISILPGFQRTTLVPGSSTTFSSDLNIFRIASPTSST